jgi:hypothetical protein
MNENQGVATGSSRAHSHLPSAPARRGQGARSSCACNFDSDIGAAAVGHDYLGLRRAAANRIKACSKGLCFVEHRDNH